MTSYLDETDNIDLVTDGRMVLNAEKLASFSAQRLERCWGQRAPRISVKSRMDLERILSVLGVFSASGDIRPGTIVHPYVKISQDVDQAVPDGWIIGRSQTEWMRSEVFLSTFPVDLHHGSMLRKSPRLCCSWWMGTNLTLL